MNKNVDNKKLNAAVNTANQILDFAFKTLNLTDSEKYHITSDELLDFYNNYVNKAKDTKERIVDTVKDTKDKYVDNLSDKLVFDFSEVKDVLTKLVSEYTDKLKDITEDNKDNIYKEDDMSCNCHKCNNNDECECNEYEKHYYGEDDYDDLDFMDDKLYDISYPNAFDKSTCRSILESLKEDFVIERAENDEFQDVESAYYPYTSVLYDINCILYEGTQDVDARDYELLLANEITNHDTIHVKYSLFCDNDSTYNYYITYVSQLQNDLTELYGFYDVHTSVSRDFIHSYMTYDIYMMI